MTSTTDSRKTLITLFAEADLKPVDIACDLRVSTTLISHWTCGRRKPTPYHRARLCILLKISERELEDALEATKKAREDS